MELLLTVYSDRLRSVLKSPDAISYDLLRNYVQYSVGMGMKRMENVLLNDIHEVKIRGLFSLHKAIDVTIESRKLTLPKI